MTNETNVDCKWETRVLNLTAPVFIATREYFRVYRLNI